MRVHGLVAAALMIGSLALADEKSADELEQLKAAANAARQAAAADPTISSPISPPVVAYLAEQKLRRLVSLLGLRDRIDQAQADPKKQELLPVLKDQMADLERKPLEPVNFDTAYNFQPTTGLVGYSKRVRLLENTSDGKLIIQVENIALLVEGMGTSQYASGKFLRVDQAILVGEKLPDRTVQGVERPVFKASLVDLKSVLDKK